jgi:hypothetical protein
MPASATPPGKVQVSVNAGGLAVNSYTAREVEGVPESQSLLTAGTNGKVRGQYQKRGR